MRERNEPLYESGHVVDVTIITLGDELEGDHADGATVLTLGDTADFDAGCQVRIDGSLYTVSAVDYDADTITLSSGLDGAKDDGETVDLWDPLYQVVSSYKSVQVRVLSEDSNEDIVEATLAMHLIDNLDEGLRGARGETVLLELDGDEWRVCDVLGFGDPDEVGSGTLFKIDRFTITTLGPQTFTLTYEPTLDSDHVYWNTIEQDGEYTIVGQQVTMEDPDGMFQVGDSVVVKYAYRYGATRVDDPVPDPWSLTIGDPVVTAGVGTTGPSVVGSGGVWSDGNLLTGAQLYCVDNALGRDVADAQIDPNTTLPTDATGLQLRCFVTITPTTANPIQDFRVRLLTAAHGILFQDIKSGAYGTLDFVMTPVGSGLQVFLDDMHAGVDCFLNIMLDYLTAPVGEEGAFVSEFYVKIEEV